MAARPTPPPPPGRSPLVAPARWLALSVALAAALLASSSRGAEPAPAPAPPGDLAAVKARGKLILLCYPLVDGTFVGIDMDALRESGVQLKDQRDPKVFRGVDVELIEGFARSLGVSLEIHPVTSGYDALLPALRSGEGDLIASSYSITPQRRETIDFSAPYVTGSIAVAVPEGSPIRSLADLKGKRVAVMRGSSQLERLQGLDLGLRQEMTDFALESYVAVSEGRADFTVLDSYAPVGASVSASYPDLKVAFALSEFSYGVGVRKGSDLLAPLDAYLADLRKSGELGRIVGRFVPEAAAGSAPRKP